jgi:hypothetical protein
MESRRQRILEREKTKMNTITLDNGLVIEGTFKHGKIVNINRVELPTSPVDLFEILPYISHDSLLNQDFYSAVQHVPNDLNLDFKEIFFQNLKKTKGKVRIIAICHSEILKPFTLPIPKLHKISVVPNGIGVFSTIRENIEFLTELTPIVSDSKFVETSKNICLAHLLYTFSQPTLPSNIHLQDKEKYDESYKVCSKITSTPEEETTKGNLIDNRQFYGNPGLSLLYIGFIPYGMTSYVYKNLFSLVPIITLETILKEYVPNCSEVTLVHKGCAKRSLCGGKRTKRKNKWLLYAQNKTQQTMRRSIY